MAQWLEEGGREPVAMESTGSYWKPLYNILEMSEMVGYRKSLIKEQSAELNRVQKLLEGANIKLSGTIANIGGS